MWSDRTTTLTLGTPALTCKMTVADLADIPLYLSLAIHTSHRPSSRFVFHVRRLQRTCSYLLGLWYVVIGLRITHIRQLPFTENCAPPCSVPGYDVVNNIRQVAHEYGSVKFFKAYLELSELSSSKSIGLRSELQSCGVSLTDCPHNGRKDVADKMMIGALYAFPRRIQPRYSTSRIRSSRYARICNRQPRPCHDRAHLGRS